MTIHNNSLLLDFSARIPVASQVTALEVWLLACILLVFGALAEYAFILRQIIYLSRQNSKQEEDEIRQSQQEIELYSPHRHIEYTSQQQHRDKGGNRGIAFKLNGGMDVVQQQEEEIENVCFIDKQPAIAMQTYGGSCSGVNSPVTTAGAPCSEACLGAPHGAQHRHQHLVHEQQHYIVGFLVISKKLIFRT